MNQITLPAADLKQALPGLSKVVSRKSTLPCLQSVRLTRTQAGVVTLAATDLDTFVSYILEQPQPGEPLDVLLPFEQLKNSGKGSDVVVAQEAKFKAKLRYKVSGSSLEQSVATLSPDEFPPTPKVTDASVKMPDNFGECLRQAFESSSQDTSRYVLQGAYLDVKEPKCHTIVSTNGRCLFAANTFKFDLKESVNLSRQKFLEWNGFLTGECEMAVKTDKSNSGWVKLTTPRWECVVKQIDGQFPNWRQVVPADTEKWTKVELSEGAIKQMLNLSSKLPGDDHENRTLQIRVGKELHLEGRNKDDKEFTSAEIAEVKIIGKSVTTALNREYLQTALKCGLNEIRIHTELEPLLFLRPGKRLVVMPVRLNGPTTQSVPAKTAAPQTSTTTPLQPNPEAQERKPDMAKLTVKTEAPKPEPSTSLLDQIEQVKESAKNLVRDLTSLSDGVKQAEKDKRANEKELENARAVLKKLQQVQI
jgi:DNA polymerase III sliding clamp (beta) subunit (PCNA family)